MSTPSESELRHLINLDGSVFSEGELGTLGAALDALSNDERVEYRNGNAQAIASLDARRLVIVAGPGSGKTHLFLERSRYWLDRSESELYVATFVRKLVKDLEADVNARLPPEQSARVSVSTLHTLARSLLERAEGTTTVPLRSHIRVIDQNWMATVWDDVLAFHPELLEEGYAIEDFERQTHALEPVESAEWNALRATHERLCMFYNGVGFAYMILAAAQAAREQPPLVPHRFWIIDEYQDFNPSEDRLIATLVENAEGVLIAGDDEQALYQTLKRATPEIILGHYRDEAAVKAMLPYCSRCGYHIVNAAAAFISAHRAEGAISKVYLPLLCDEESPRVQVVAAARSISAVDYIKKLLDDHRNEYDEYLERRAVGEDTDPFLLVLSTSGGVTRAGRSQADAELEDFVAEHSGDTQRFSGDYFKLLSYLGAWQAESDNFALRKILAYENVDADVVHGFIAGAIENDTTLAAIVRSSMPDLMTKIATVGELIESSPGDPHGVAQELAAHLSISEPAALGRELEATPIGEAPARDREDDEAIETAGALGPVVAMSMVGSKGLSAHHVVVVGCDDVNMAPVGPLVFFVAMTRARRSLHLIASAQTGGSTAPHRYLHALPPEHCEYLVYKKTGRAVEPLNGFEELARRFATWNRMSRR